MKYLDIPGSKTHELPPLFLHGTADGLDLDPDVKLAMPEAEEMLAATDADPSVLERRKFELALQLNEQYNGLKLRWSLGDSVLEWIRQCEFTFQCIDTLRQLLYPDVWPHAGRASFVELLDEKHVVAQQGALKRAVGLRLTFRQPPPITCCSNQLLLYLNGSVEATAFNTWSHLGQSGSVLLPPDRFHFEVVDLCA
jgi:hypothetical protein